MSFSIKNLDKDVIIAFNYIVLSPEDRKSFEEKYSSLFPQLKEHFIDSNLLIPRFLFNQFISENDFHLTADTFSRNYSNYFIKLPNGKRSISLEDAIFVMDDLRNRKFHIEHGHRITDINEELSLNKEYDALLKRYTRLNKRGFINLHFLPSLDSSGETPRESSSYVFDKKDYGKVVAFELQELILKNMHESGELITVSELSEKLGLNSTYTARLIRSAAKKYGATMYELRSLAGNVLQTYVPSDSINMYLSNDSSDVSKPYSRSYDNSDDIS